MKRLTSLTLVLAMTALAGCGEKQADTAAAPATAKTADTATTPNAPPQATEQVAANSGHPGQAIHDANCISCHDSGVYTRADRKMTSLDMLAGQVRRCDANLGTKLFDEDLDNVTAFLNETYYKFPK
ncbi:MAG: hypothetical protein QJT81_05555 [Candidatus Thiothrix putei]|uniref:Cytochrome c domain-containing protein n=2 Tax=Thiothrix TaxID=1030 RepID=A0A1H4ELC6_9GAMM|nr:hypothetical protein [Thiothrix caldifontis]WGZ95453.1 MAG: hypothetical protein QJT81_05555 [Candidatus Thiothrix putei]SEA85350.1 hypothetical protein SAMN05660964_02618 [Thiothrix caldifontis]